VVRVVGVLGWLDGVDGMDKPPLRVGSVPFQSGKFSTERWRIYMPMGMVIICLDLVNLRVQRWRMPYPGRCILCEPGLGPGKLES
jgi:hypothetical protein